MDIFEYPSPVLKEPATEVVDHDRDLAELVKTMIHVMQQAPGVGLAATQLGVQQRVIVYQADPGGSARALVNPRIVESSSELSIEEEGCLSFPGIAVAIERPAFVVCEGTDHQGVPVRVDASDLLARILQHEIDHLDGVLIIDRAAPDDRREALRRYREVNET